MIAPSRNVVEIGFGPRPGRLFWMTGISDNVSGIDVDEPVLRPSIGSLLNIARRKGGLRAVKTGVRSVVFDRQYYLSLRRAYREQFQRDLDIAKADLRIGSAGDPSTWRGLDKVDLVYSEDVFEHIPRQSISEICRVVQKRLAPRGLLIANINVFTGITGGHLPKWYIEKGFPSRRRRRPRHGGT